MAHIIPLSVTQRRGDAGSAMRLADASLAEAAARPLDEYWQAVAAHHQQRLAQQQAFDTEIAAHRLDGEIASAEADTVANAPADGEGLHHVMYGEIDRHSGRVVQKGRFDTLLDTFVNQAPPELRPGLASRKEALREAGSVRMAMRQLQRRVEYERDHLATIQAEELDTIAKSDPDDIPAFDAARRTGLDLIAKMNLDAESRQKAEAAWRESTARTRLEALIARNPKRAAEMLGAWSVANDRQAGTAGAEALADLSPEDTRRLLGQARTATATRLIEVRANIDLASQNGPDAIANTGNYPGAMPSPADFTDVYGVEEGGKRYHDFSRKIDAGRQAFGMRTMPNQAIHAMLRDAASATTTSQEKVRSNHDPLAEAANETLRARTADPGAYVRRVFPIVDEAWKNVSDTKGHQNAILWSVSAQHQLGLEDIQPLPNAIAEDAVIALIGDNSQSEETRALGRILLDATTDTYLRMSLVKQLIYSSIMMSLSANRRVR